MAQLLAEFEAGNVDVNSLDDLQKAQLKHELQQRNAARREAEARTARKTHESAVKQKGLNEQMGPRQPGRPRAVDTGRFSGPAEPLDPAAREAVAQNRAADSDAVRGLDRNATPQYKEPTMDEVGTAARDRLRGPGSEAPLSRRSVGGTGYTGSQTGDLESRPGAIERGLRAVGATGAADKRAEARIGAREGLVEQTGSGKFKGTGVETDARAATGDQTRRVAEAQTEIDTAQERKRRAQRTINTSKNPADVEAARAAVSGADADIEAASTRKAAIGAEARPKGGQPVTDAVERAKAAVKDPVGTADAGVKKANEAIDDVISKVDDKTKGPLKKLKTALGGAVEKGKAKVAGLKGGASASASVDAGVEELTKNMPEGPQKAGAIRSLGTLGKAAGAVGLVDMMGSYLRNVYETDFRTANVDLIEGISQLVEAGGETIEGVRSDDIGMDEVVVELARGVYDSIVGVVPSLIDNGQFFAGEAFDAVLGMPGAEAATAPDQLGLRGGGEDFVGPADPGELPGRPGVRYDPLSETADLELRSGDVQTDPFLTPGAREGQFNVGLRGGTGVIDATNAPGGATGFAQRVEESRRAGAYDPVSDERREEAQRDLQRVKRGTAAIRDLAASRLGVPTQYLDAVRSGSMTPREANLTQAKQNASGNAGGMSAAEVQQFQHRAAAEQRAVNEFTGKLTDQARARVTETGMEVANSFPGANEEKKAEIASGYAAFASNWIPEGTDPSSLTATDHQTIKGQYILATELANKGEGWFRALLPWKADITANTLFSRGENILQSMEQTGTFWDIGDDNYRFEGRDSDGQPVHLTIQPEDLHPVAQGLFNEARSSLNIRKKGIR